MLAIIYYFIYRLLKIYNGEIQMNFKKPHSRKYAIFSINQVKKKRIL